MIKLGPSIDDDDEGLGDGDDLPSHLRMLWWHTEPCAPHSRRLRWHTEGERLRRRLAKIIKEQDGKGGDAGQTWWMRQSD